MKTYKLTCVSYDGTVGTMVLQSETPGMAVAEMKRYPAVKYVIGIEEVAE
ncbi:hypothetical protein [Enterococcus dispar]